MNQPRRNQSMSNLQHKLLRLPQVKSITGLSKSSIYARISEGTFPQQIPLGPRLVVWVESDIQKWAKVVKSSGAKID
jgi:prophage regulatory protein